MPPSTHILLIDDSWITGAHVQGVASALKAAGAQDVSIFTVARVLDPRWSANHKFMQARFGENAFDWARCPWTGGDCPEFPPAGAS